MFYVKIRSLSLTLYLSRSHTLIRSPLSAAGPMEALVKHHNPLADLISDEVYQMLVEHDLLDEKGVRDYCIRQRFRQLRAQNVSAYDAIERIQEEYPYLQFDTIRKIVYRSNGQH